MAGGDERRPPRLPHPRLLPRQFSRCGGLLPRVRRHAARQSVGRSAGAYHRLRHPPDGQARGQPLFQHHCRRLCHGRTGLPRRCLRAGRLCGRGHHRLTDDPGSRSAHHQLHARHHLRRHQLRYFPPRPRGTSPPPSTAGPPPARFPIPSGFRPSPSRSPAPALLSSSMSTAGGAACARSAAL